jgi:hypothetical protein
LNLSWVAFESFRASAAVIFLVLLCANNTPNPKRKSPPAARYQGRWIPQVSNWIKMIFIIIVCHAPSAGAVLSATDNTGAFAASGNIQATATCIPDNTTSNDNNDNANTSGGSSAAAAASTGTQGGAKKRKKKKAQTLEELQNKTLQERHPRIWQKNLPFMACKWGDVIDSEDERVEMFALLKYKLLYVQRANGPGRLDRKHNK